MGQQLFYVQEATDTLGNVMLWLKADNDGYACDIREAKKFTKAEIVEMDIIGKRSKCVWPVEYINERIKHYIDERSCRYAYALKLEDEPENESEVEMACENYDHICPKWTCLQRNGQKLCCVDFKSTRCEFFGNGDRLRILNNESEV